MSEKSVSGELFVISTQSRTKLKSRELLEEKGGLNTGKSERTNLSLESSAAE